MQQPFLLLVFAFVMYHVVTWIFQLVFAPIPLDKPQGPCKCKSCDTVIPEGEEQCYYCEMVDFRKWKRDQKKKK
ncbi:MAG: hypothetical protein D6722_28375 [Bacteroidetes bacterium]|nr:MAG: hypothetical protein D6722_28375 [Bacteroidota bacterium]